MPVTHQRKRRLAIAGLIIGGLLGLAPTLGMLGSVRSMSRAQQVMGSSGIQDPRGVATLMGESILYLAVSGLLALIGFVLIAISIVALVRRSPPPLPPPAG